MPPFENFENAPAGAQGGVSAWFGESDGPQTRIDRRLDGDYEVPLAARPGNAQQIIELIQSGGFQNRDGSLTAAGAEAIRAAVANTGLFQTYEGRAQQVQNFVNRQLIPPGGITLNFNRDHANANTLMGSRPYVEASVGGGVTRIPMGR